MTNQSFGIFEAFRCDCCCSAPCFSFILPKYESGRSNWPAQMIVGGMWTLFVVMLVCGLMLLCGLLGALVTAVKSEADQLKSCCNATVKMTACVFICAALTYEVEVSKKGLDFTNTHVWFGTLATATFVVTEMLTTSLDNEKRAKLQQNEDISYRIESTNGGNTDDAFGEDEF